MAVRFNTPPGWPVPPETWAPHDDWMPDPSWPTPPRGWTFWTVVEQNATPVAPVAGAYGTDRGSWLASLRARAASSTAVVPVAPTPEPDAVSDAVSDDWALDGLLASTGRADL